MKITLTRYSLSEIDAAIAEKEKLGWTLVKKARVQSTYVGHKYYPSRKHSRVTQGAEVFGKWQAELKRG